MSDDEPNQTMVRLAGAVIALEEVEQLLEGMPEADEIREVRLAMMERVDAISEVTGVPRPFD